eukprot:CAMPEP_0115329490 /NCGR_PEP_ID=MMETSP0270-20121206/85259_1 /TAXON_ID=71861 /ORGANISM="Scrippsiella trochoidea, Strain CCMP3099" /LENGTH=47 /DNA_ID= /DNA_START= /DNA_END= /DNA_ORIENTATION=
MVPTLPWALGGVELHTSAGESSLKAAAPIPPSGVPAEPVAAMTASPC